MKVPAASGETLGRRGAARTRTFPCAGAPSGRGSRHGKHHFGPVARRAGHRNGAAVQLGNALDDREAQSLAALGARRRNALAALVEAIEQVRQIGRRNPRAAVGNANPDLVAVDGGTQSCLLYTSPSPRDGLLSRMPSSA